MASVSTDSRGRVYLRGTNGRFATPTTNEERKMIEKARKQIAKENKSRVSGISRTEPTGKEKSSNKRERSKFAASHGPKSSAKSGRSTSGRFAVSDSKALTRSKSLSVTNADSGYEGSRSKSKRPSGAAMRSARSDSVSEASQRSQANSVAAPNRRGRPAKSAKKSVSEENSQANLLTAPRRSARLAAKRRSSSTKSKSSIRSLTDVNQNIVSKSTVAPRRSARLAELVKSRLSRTSAKRAQMEAAKLLSFSDSVSDGESNNPQVKLAVAPRRSARLAAKGRSY